jgi:hypothetical protein
MEVNHFPLTFIGQLGPTEVRVYLSVALIVNHLPLTRMIVTSPEWDTPARFVCHKINIQIMGR